ncbi:MAG: hypothetical protein KDC92_08885 [Bacteroidetes bacterium]|nr:hypothetical protein [Bacteroidota bacterium]
MKKFLFPLMILSAFFIVACGPDEPTTPEETEEEKAARLKMESVPEESFNLFYKSSGSKCPPCGGWGWTLMEAAISQLHDEAAPIVGYSQNFVAYDFINSAATEYDGINGIDKKGWPSFIMNDERLEPAGQTIDQVVSDAMMQARNTYALHEDDGVLANGVFNWKVENNRVSGNVRVRFFKETSGTYLASVWFDESGMMAPQSGHPDGVVAHHHALRQISSESVMGDEIAKGDIAKDAVYELSFSDIEFPEGAWDVNNTEATLVIYKKVGTTYKFINASKTEVDFTVE